MRKGVTADQNARAKLEEKARVCAWEQSEINFGDDGNGPKIWRVSIPGMHVL